jgi:hypothetical protein
MQQLLHTPPPEPSSRAKMFLRPRRKYIEEWWKSGSGEDTPLNMELLQVAYSPPEVIDPIPLTVTPMRATDRSSDVPSGLPGPGPCSKCNASRAIARRAVVALRDCAVHMEASRQFAEWSAGQSQRVIKACRKLCLEHRRLGHTIGLEDLARLGTKDSHETSGTPGHNQATTYPSADGINWDLFPYEDTQGPLLSPDISLIQDSLPRSPEHPLADIIPPTTQFIGEDGVNIDRWAAEVPGLVTTNPSPAHVVDHQVAFTQTRVPCFANASVQAPSVHGRRISDQPSYNDHAGQLRPTNGVSASDVGPSASVQAGHPLPQTLPDIIMGDDIHASSGTDISSAGLSSNSSGTVASSSIESEGASDMSGDSDMDGGSDMGEDEYDDEEGIAAAYTGD